jgi:ATP-dependent exoDNAse (exonuclease V) beta subunit
MIRVTELVASLFSTFDADIVLSKMSIDKKNERYPNMTDDEIKTLWNNKSEGSRTQGTNMHAIIEKLLKTETSYEDVINDDSYTDNIKIMTKQFENFRHSHPEWEIHSIERKITSHSKNDIMDLKLSGIIDAIYDTPDGLVIVDWKCSKNINTDRYFAYANAPISHIPDCNFYKYTLQLNLYRYIAEVYENLRITGLKLVQLHNTLNDYVMYDVPDLSNEVYEILTQRANSLSTIIT